MAGTNQSNEQIFWTIFNSGKMAENARLQDVISRWSAAVGGRVSPGDVAVLRSMVRGENPQQN